MREAPGNGANQCGAGIPAGTKLAWNYIYSSSPALIGNQATDFVSKAKQAGINITLSSSNFNYMITNYIDPAAPANINKWAMMDFGGETNVPYPTTFGLFNTGGTNQIGDYSNPQADSLINASISGGDPAAVKNEAAFLTTRPAGAVPAQPGRHLGLEDHPVRAEPAGMGEPDPVLRHAGVLVLQQVTVPSGAGLPWSPVIHRRPGQSSGRTRPHEVLRRRRAARLNAAKGRQDH